MELGLGERVGHGRHQGERGQRRRRRRRRSLDREQRTARSGQGEQDDEQDRGDDVPAETKSPATIPAIVVATPDATATQNGLSSGPRAQ